MRTRAIGALAWCLVMAAGVSSTAADRIWQTGKWMEAHIKRPRIVLGIGGNPVGGGVGPRSAPPMMEVREYVIETSELRLELRENVRADTHRLDAMIGEPVTFALEKKMVYIKDDLDMEHELRVIKQSAARTPQ